MNRLTTILLLLLLSIRASAHVYGDSAIYQGLFIKLDLATPTIEVARSKGTLQTYEGAISVRLKNRYYPTLEGGYSFGKRDAEGGLYKGKGGFVRLGLDFNGLRKRIESPHALLVGLRVCSALQRYDLCDVKQNTPYWDTGTRVDFLNRQAMDWWGEIVAGCNVNIASGFYMGWAVRFKLLFTSKNKDQRPEAYYIPGFGFRNNTNWGVNYYIGWRI